jgi:hypothetical protein
MLDRLRPDLEAGRVVLGGCCVFQDSPQWKCQGCGHSWGRTDDLDEMRRLRQEVEALPKPIWRRLQALIGISFEDENSFFNALARRLAWTTAGIGVALLTGAIISPWVGLVLLAIWLLPLLWHIALRVLAGVVAIGLVTMVVGLRPLNWRMAAAGAGAVGFLVLTFLELGLLISAFAYAGGGLLSEAMG